MAGETNVAVVGNLTADPELRATANGVPVANFTVATTPRSFDRESGEWQDGETMFLGCTVWRGYAEHVAESLEKGQQVIVTGRLVQRSYEKDGERRVSTEVQVEHVGPALQYATAVVTKVRAKAAVA